jgi:hypothetical protein
MDQYPQLRNTLGTVFSVTTGLSDDAQRRMLEQVLQQPEWRKAFQEELRTAMTDSQTSWVDLLANERYEVYEADSEEDARRIAVSLLWETTFPGQSLPEIQS